MIKKLLCATDGSKASDKAVDFAVQFAKQLGAELAFVTVSTVTEESVSHSRFWNSEELSAIDEQVHRELAGADAKAKAGGIGNYKCVAVHSPSISAGVIGYAEENGFDHIVTGSTGKTGISRVLMGSVASDVVARAHCPVTVVR
jgi:nucleotide-binding universal stress UspA family protein